MFQVHWCNRASPTRLLSPRSNFLSFFQRGDSEPGSLMAPVRDEQTKLTAVQPYHRISRPLNSNSEQTETSAWCMCPSQHDYEGLFHRLEGWRVYALDLDIHFGVSRPQNNPDFTSHSYFNQVSRISCTHYKYCCDGQSTAPNSTGYDTLDYTYKYHPASIAYRSAGL